VIKVLHVDDNVDDLELTRLRILQIDKELQIESAESVAEALQKAESDAARAIGKNVRSVSRRRSRLGYPGSSAPSSKPYGEKSRTMRGLELKTEEVGGIACRKRM